MQHPPYFRYNKNIFVYKTFPTNKRRRSSIISCSCTCCFWSNQRRRCLLRYITDPSGEQRTSWPIAKTRHMSHRSMTVIMKILCGRWVIGPESHTRVDNSQKRSNRPMVAISSHPPELCGMSSTGINLHLKPRTKRSAITFPPGTYHFIDLGPSPVTDYSGVCIDQ